MIRSEESVCHINCERRRWSCFLHSACCEPDQSRKVALQWNTTLSHHVWIVSVTCYNLTCESESAALAQERAFPTAINRPCLMHAVVSTIRQIQLPHRNHCASKHTPLRCFSEPSALYSSSYSMPQFQVLLPSVAVRTLEATVVTTAIRLPAAATASATQVAARVQVVGNHCLKPLFGTDNLQSRSFAKSSS